MITRRGLLAGMLSACMSPAIVRAGSLMRLPTRVPKLYNLEIGKIDGFRFIESRPLRMPTMSAGGIFLMDESLSLRKDTLGLWRVVHLPEREFLTD